MIINSNIEYITLVTFTANLFLIKDNLVTQTKEKSRVVYEEGTVNNLHCQKWFAKIRTGDFLFIHSAWFGRPVKYYSRMISFVTHVR